MSANPFDRLETVAVERLPERLHFREQLGFPDDWKARRPPDWTMESDDLVLRYIFRNARPRRHLEFGTWEGEGVLRCLEECDATVWTINLLEGESNADGGWAYGAEEHLVAGASARHGERYVTHDTTWVRTDAQGLIGHKYLARHAGNRVCQIYCDSRSWDTRQYPNGFFDTAFIDGGHSGDVVHADTWKTIELIRHRGLVMWHDFCPRADALEFSATAKQVTDQLRGEWPALSKYFNHLFWIEPSWLLVGVRNRAMVRERPSLGARVGHWLQRSVGSR